MKLQANDIEEYKDYKIQFTVTTLFCGTASKSIHHYFYTIIANVNTVVEGVTVIKNIFLLRGLTKWVSDPQGSTEHPENHCSDKVLCLCGRF